MANYDLNALSGINAASNGLGVISNNLANAQTVGFKSSRAEFADMFYGAQKSPGNGVRVGAITQDFTQGSINDTGRELDMAIDGEGFFILEDKTGKYENVYTRNGSFKLDKEGYMTDQAGNKLQGYLLNEEASTETNPVFNTALESIDLDDLNKIPKATDEMKYDINLDGEEVNNVDPTGTNTGVDGTDDSVGSSQNLLKLVDPENNNASGGAFAGSPDYFYPKTIYDSLGGEHNLNSNFYKRDVVTADVSTIDANGNNVPPGDGVKYTSWIVQYTITAEDDQGNTQYTGHVMDPAATPQQASTYAGQIYELRFDTDGNYLGAYAPATTAAPNDQYDPIVAPGGAADSDPAAGTAAEDLGNLTVGTSWVPLTGTPKLNFMIDNPLTGATDPLGGPTQGTPAAFEIELDMQEMSQFAGAYTQRGTTQNGYAIGDLVGINTGQDGVIEARYSNGRSVPVAQLALANFNDKNAMEKLGGQTYAETFASGPVQISAAEQNGYGSISAGSLEYSNVDTTGELVNMIQTQRTYQASAQVISTSQTLTQTILNL